MKKFLALSLHLLISSFLFAQNLPSYLPSNGLVAWFPFNGNANDESGNGNNFINSNFSFDNPAPELDSTANTYGINAEYFLISPSLFPSTASYTFRFTYIFQSGNSAMMIWLGSINRSLYINITQQNINFGLSGGGSGSGDWTTPTLGIGIKNEILVKVSYNGQYYFVVNDSTFGPFYWTPVEFPCLVSLNSQSVGECSSPSFYIYYEPNNNSIIIDDITLYNRLLSDQEISAIQTQTPVSEIISNAQVPPGIPYQAVVRNANGSVAANTAVTTRFTLHQTTADGTVEFQETHALTTNAQGLMSTVLGQGTAVQNTFAGINWANTTKFLQVEVDLGNGYVDLGTQQLMSVPYALYAANGPQGAQGPAGPQGPAGADGAPGPQGIQGPAGTSVQSVVQSNNQWVITFSDGSTTTFPIGNGNSATNSQTFHYLSDGF